MLVKRPERASIGEIVGRDHFVVCRMRNAKCGKQHGISELWKNELVITF